MLTFKNNKTPSHKKNVITLFVLQFKNINKTDFHGKKYIKVSAEFKNNIRNTYFKHTQNRKFLHSV